MNKKMNLHTIGLLLLIFTLQISFGQQQQQQQEQQQDQDSIKGQSSKNSPIALPPSAIKGQQPPRKIISNSRPVAKPPKGVQDHTEIVPLNDNDEDEEEEDDDAEPIIGENKRVPVPITPALITLARRLRSSSSSISNVQSSSDADNQDFKQNWWQRKDLRLRKLHKKLDPEEQQMMELMYGGFNL